MWPALKLPAQALVKVPFYACRYITCVQYHTCIQYTVYNMQDSISHYLMSRRPWWMHTCGLWWRLHPTTCGRRTRAPTSQLTRAASCTSLLPSRSGTYVLQLYSNTVLLYRSRAPHTCSANSAAATSRHPGDGTVYPHACRALTNCTASLYCLVHICTAVLYCCTAIIARRYKSETGRDLETELGIHPDTRLPRTCCAHRECPAFLHACPPAVSKE